MPNLDGAGSKHCSSQGKGLRACKRKGERKKIGSSCCFNSFKKRSIHDMENLSKQEQKKYLLEKLEKIEEQKEFINKKINELEEG